MSSTVTHLWKPSNARYLQIDGFIETPRGPQIPPPRPLIWPKKDPADVLDYIFDIAPAISADSGDGISTLNVSVSPSNPGDLTINSSAVEGTRVILWMSGGQTETIYTVTITVGTMGGRVLARSVSLPVVALAIQPIPADALMVASDQALTEPSGTLLTIF